MAKEYKVRQSQKTDTSENWDKASGFTPHKGEIIVYQDGDNSKIKIGTGVTEVDKLPFVAGGGASEEMGDISAALDEIIESQALYMGKIDEILTNQNSYIVGEV